MSTNLYRYPLGYGDNPIDALDICTKVSAFLGTVMSNMDMRELQMGHDTEGLTAIIHAMERTIRMAQEDIKVTNYPL